MYTDMRSLAEFPPAPPTGCVTICEFEGQLVTSHRQDAIREFTDQLNSYPAIEINIDTLRPSVSRESVKNAFLQHRETVWKKAALAWREQGIVGALEELSSDGENYSINRWTKILAKSILTGCRWLQTLYGSVFPHLVLSKEDLSEEFSTALDWSRGTIRAFAWHPQTIKCALALCNDSIHIYAPGSQLTPLLKHRFQKGVIDLAWKPYCASLLAVACHGAVLVWQIDPTSVVSRPSSSCVTLLIQNGHSPVTSIAWHPDSNLLLSASALDTNMMVWDVDIGTPLRRIGGGGVSLLKWSADGCRLLAGTPSTLFRVWETRHWTCERWSNLFGRCCAACWSPDGCILLFVTKDQPTIYSLSFTPSSEIKPCSIGGSKSAIPVMDLTEVMIQCGTDKVRVGGRVHNMIWDRTGERLAVTFRDNPELIAIFTTRIRPTFEIVPCGFVRGPATELPQCICFHDSFKAGALLTVCWMGGKVSHIPLLFVPDSLNQSGGQLYLDSVNSAGNVSPFASHGLYSAT